MVEKFVTEVDALPDRFLDAEILFLSHNSISTLEGFRQVRTSIPRKYGTYSHSGIARRVLQQAIAIAAILHRQRGIDGCGSCRYRQPSTR